MAIVYNKIMYTAIYKKSGKYYSAWVQEIPGVNTQGRTKKEAECNLKEALEMVLAAREKYFKKELGKAKVERAPLVLA
jgi:predicted RNase H-like HicB family nuclease